MSKPFIIHRGNKLFFDLPSEWSLLTLAAFDDLPQQEEPLEMIQEALRYPVASPLLKDCVSSSDEVAILVEDITRASPKKLVLEALLAELKSIGLPEDRISVIIALGTHRGLSPQEMEATFGKSLLAGYEFINHDCHASDLVPAGKLLTGRAVRINRKVAAAAFKVGIGSIFPHPMNGFGGGAKILFPGVADFESIKEHHFRYTFHEGTGLGKIKGNRFYDQVCAVARAAKLNFVINSIMDQNDRVAGVVAGHPVEAHLAGIDKSRAIVSRRFDKRADITIITSFPYTEGPQIVKPLIPASMVTKEGGFIILSAECSGNLPDPFIQAFERFHAGHKGNLHAAVLEHFENNRPIMKEGAIDFNMALGLTLALQHRHRIVLVSEDIPRDKAQKMGFLYAETLGHAFDLITAEHPRAEVHVIPSGGVVLPVI